MKWSKARWMLVGLVFVSLSIFGCHKGSSISTGTCGDNIAEGEEECDGTDLRGESCESLNLGTGTLGCIDCHYDTSGCSNPQLCGNNTVNNNEDCDGTDLDGQTCESLNLGTGNLLCDSDCNFDTGGCSGQADCGNALIEYPETCDGTNLGNATCESIGQPSGVLACLGDCTDFDISGCVGDQCGDGEITGNETCDGTNLGGSTCADFGFLSGTLACQPDCTAFDMTGCRNTPPVLVTEMGLGNPDWVELYNTSQQDVELEGWQLQWWGYNNMNQPVGNTYDLPAYTLAGGERVVILDEYGGNPQELPTVDTINRTIQFHDNIWWGSNQGAVAFSTSDGSPVDFVRYGGTAFDPPAGFAWTDGDRIIQGFDDDDITLSRIPDGVDTDSGNDFCTANVSQGEANNPCFIPAMASILITEINVGQPDIFELYNAGTDPVELRVLVINWSAGGQAGSFSIPSSYVLDAGEYVSIADGLGYDIQVYTNINWSSNENGACEIVGDGYTMDFVRWGGSTIEPTTGSWADTPDALGMVPNDQSLGRQSLTDSDTAADFCFQNSSFGDANQPCL